MPSYVLSTRTHTDQEWTAEAHIEFMQRTNITLSILSIPSPGTNLSTLSVPPHGGVHTLTRAFNTELCDVCKRHPEHFAFFASLPLPDVDATLSEVDYALDTLGAVGFSIMSNANGIYPGDPSLDAVWRKLDERKAVVFIHPTSCCIQTPTGPQMLQPLPNLPNLAIEFQFDETRAVINLLISGTVRRYPSISYIMTDAGCVLPAVLERVESLTSFYANLSGRVSPASSGSSVTISQNQDTPPMEEIGFRQQLQNNFFFDLAGMPFPEQFRGLKNLVWSNNMLYGSDYPFISADLAYELAEDLNYRLSEYMGRDNEMGEVYTHNAEALLRPKPVKRTEADERSGGTP